MSIKVGSARIDERGKISGGKAGDQTGKELSIQNFYVHSKGWYIIRPKSIEHSKKIAKAMETACNNKHIGYDQNERFGIIKQGINSTKDIEADCSTTVRACIIAATGKDPGNFSTADERKVLLATKLFDDIGAYTSNTKIYDGDILVTKTKGHTVIVTSGSPRLANPKSDTQASSKPTSAYSKRQFIIEVQIAIGAKPDGIAGKETLSKTPTVSKSKNRTHAVVAPLQKYFNSLGYNCGEVDKIAGNKFDTAVKEFQEDKKIMVKGDGELTAQGDTWKYILGLKK